MFCRFGQGEKSRTQTATGTVGQGNGCARCFGTPQKVQYPLIREYTLNPSRDPKYDLRYPKLKDIGLPGLARPVVGLQAASVPQ